MGEKILQVSMLLNLLINCLEEIGQRRVDGLPEDDDLIAVVKTSAADYRELMDSDPFADAVHIWEGERDFIEANH